MKYTNDEQWQTDKARFNWNLPPAAPKWQRLPGIRHLIAWSFEYHVEKKMKICRMNLSSADGSTMPGYFAWAAYAIKRGWY